MSIPRIRGHVEAVSLSRCRVTATRTSTRATVATKSQPSAKIARGFTTNNSTDYDQHQADTQIIIIAVTPARALYNPA
jgi:hypothetical protein